MASNYETTNAKPANDAYTGMLAISLVALLIGSAVLYLDFSQYPATPPPKVDYSFKARQEPPDQIPRAQAEPKLPDEIPPDELPKDIPAKKDQ
jgi:hypothetical protein